MNKTLAFLEVLGRDARLAQSSAAELSSAALAAGVEPRLAEALGRRDQVAFKHLLSALLLSLGLALPPDGYAAVAAPSETESADEDSAPEPEDPPRSEAAAPSAPSNDNAPVRAPASGPEPISEPTSAESPQADPTLEAAAEGDTTEGSEDDAAPEDVSDEGATELESNDVPADESRDDGESAEPEEDVNQP